MLLERTVPVWRELENAIESARDTDALDFWRDFVDGLVGLDEVNQLVETARNMLERSPTTASGRYAGSAQLCHR